jgi:tetratricopeptide (TPR) repeat protein
VVGGLAAHDEVTDSKGNFILTLSRTVKPGQIIRLIVDKDGYDTYDEQVSAAGSLPLHIAIALSHPQSHMKSLSARGYVKRMSDGAAVVGAQVLIRGGPNSRPTGKAGEFIIENIPPPIDVGFPVTFDVVGWIVEDPYSMGERGRTYLPNPVAEPITLSVLAAGDRAFLEGPAIEKMLGQRVFLFEDRMTASGRDTYWHRKPERTALRRLLRPNLHVAALQAQPARESLAVVSRSFGAHSGDEKQAVSSGWDEFMETRANEIGIPKQQLLMAVEKWIPTVRTDYQKGLAALYRGDYAQSANNFHQALEEHSAPMEEIYMSVAYAEYRRGNFSEASSFLSKLVSLHPSDPLLQRNVSLVRKASMPAPLREAGAANTKRFGICREVMGGIANHDLPSLTGLFDIRSRSLDGRSDALSEIDKAAAAAGEFKLVLRQSTFVDKQELLYVTTSQFDTGEVDLLVTFNDNDQITGIWLPPGDKKLVRARAAEIASLIAQGQSDELVQQFSGDTSNTSARNDARGAVLLAGYETLQGVPAIDVDPRSHVAEVVWQVSPGNDASKLRAPPGNSLSVTISFDYQLRITSLKARKKN